jgi:hypothetical protein
MPPKTRTTGTSSQRIFPRTAARIDSVSSALNGGPEPGGSPSSLSHQGRSPVRILQGCHREPPRPGLEVPLPNTSLLITLISVYEDDLVVGSEHGA